MLNIDIRTIPHDKQRYRTSGDYYREKHKQHFRISELGNKDYELCVAVHELVEAYLCEKRNIAWEEIDKFDLEFEKNRKEGDLGEPGDSPSCPYEKEHRFAENIERLLAHELRVNWREYNKKLEEL